MIDNTLDIPLMTLSRIVSMDRSVDTFDSPDTILNIPFVNDAVTVESNAPSNETTNEMSRLIYEDIELELSIDDDTPLVSTNIDVILDSEDILPINPTSFTMEESIVDIPSILLDRPISLTILPDVLDCPLTTDDNCLVV
jgi:hypothetical protein